LRVFGSEGLEAELRKEPAGHVKVVIRRAGVGAEPQQLTWKEAIEGLCAQSPSLRELLSQTLQKLPFDAFFWECPPVSLATCGTRLFEFVALPAPGLRGTKADETAFSEHIRAYYGQPVAKAFLSLRKDSMLIAPARAQKDMKPYAHIASFFREAPPKQLDRQWLALAEALDERLRKVDPDANVWVSTSGLAVPWLHMRLDARPKYYQHAPYRNPDHGLLNGNRRESKSQCSPCLASLGLGNCLGGCSLGIF